jgi:GNAT superfamily N-acetyltransferase
MLERFRTNCPWTLCICAPIQSANLEGQLFDAAVAWGVLFHLPHDEQRKATAKIASVLKPGGLFLFTAGDQDGEKEGDSMNGVPFHYWSFSVEGYRKLLRQDGLTLLDVHRDAGQNVYYLARKMTINIVEESMYSLSEHVTIPIAFEVERVLDVLPSSDGFDFTERLLDSGYVKDYDALEHPGDWNRFDTSKWNLFAAYADRNRVGGAIVAIDTPEIDLLEGRNDLAVLWDLRVLPERRAQGIGTALLRAAEAFAARKGCRELKVETQNINVPACWFYQRQGFVLSAANRFAYPTLPDEVQLIWRKRLAGDGR